MKKLTSTLTIILLLVTFAFAGQEKKAEKAAPAAKAEKAAPAAKAEKAAPAAVVVDDATLTTNVKDKLSKTPSLKDAQIAAAVKDGVVTLTGKLKNGGLKGVATNVTKSVKGVKKVDNQITTEPVVKKEVAPKKEATPKTK